jgi:hypothetical protein
MIRSNFQIVFSVEVSHTYFKENVCKCLQFNPGGVTGALSKRFDLRIRKRISGFDFYVNTRSSLNAFIQYIAAATGQTFFDFDIVTLTPAFNFFTDFPANWLGQLIYDSRSASNIYSEGTVQLVPDPLSGARASHIGKLRVCFEDIINQGYTKFAITYMARATQWQYFIINNSSVQLQNPSISGKTDISFVGPEHVTIDNGQQAMLFTSGDKLIPLAEVPKYKFNLVNNPALQAGQKPASAKVIFRGLPNPDPIRIGAEMNGNTVQVVSPMYVYV